MSLHSGDNCPKCGQGRMRAITSRKINEQFQQQRLECNRCKHRGNGVVPAERIWRRGA